MEFDGPYDSVTRNQNLLILTWKLATEDMSTADFFEAMVRLGTLAQKAPTTGLLIDVRQFRHRPTEDVMAYRKKHVIPLYNSAGIKRMAFLFPEGHEGEASQDPGADYVVERFTKEDDAQSWASSQ